MFCYVLLLFPQFYYWQYLEWKNTCIHLILQAYLVKLSKTSLIIYMKCSKYIKTHTKKKNFIVLCVRALYILRRYIINQSVFFCTGSGGVRQTYAWQHFKKIWVAYSNQQNKQILRYLMSAYCYSKGKLLIFFRLNIKYLHNKMHSKLNFSLCHS